MALVMSLYVGAMQSISQLEFAMCFYNTLQTVSVQMYQTCLFLTVSKALLVR
jgi:hypothetical protein